MTPSKLFRTLAIAEAITWTLLIAGLIAKYAAGLDWATMVGGSIHGFVFLGYVATVIVVSIDQRWTFAQLAAGIGSAIIPYLTLLFEKFVEKKQLITDPWQLGAGGRTPAGPLEKAVAWAIRKPVPAFVVALVIIAVVFAILLAIGNPKDLIASK